MISSNQFNQEFGINQQKDILDMNDYNHDVDTIEYSEDVYDDIIANELQDNTQYTSTLTKIERSYSSSSNIPQIDFIYEVKIDNGNVKEITDSFPIFKNNKDYLKTTFMRLKQVTSNLGITLVREDLRSITSIISACQPLIGRQAKIQQYSKGYFKRYLIFKAD